MGARSGGGTGTGTGGGGVPKAVLNVEASIKGEAREHIYVFTQKGKLLASNKGTSNQVAIDVPKNSIVTHNHPAGSDLSKSDVINAIEANASEIRAVTTKGVYSVKRPKGGWGVTPDQFNKHYWTEFSHFSDLSSNKIKAEGYGWLKGEPVYTYVTRNALRATTKKFNLKHTFS